MGVFFVLDGFDFSSDFFALEVFVFRDLSFSLINKCQPLNSSGGNSLQKSQMENAPILLSPLQLNEAAVDYSSN